MDAPRTYHVTRRPGAPPRRAGRVWPVGTTAAALTPDQAARVAADPGYLIEAPPTPPADPRASPTKPPARPAKRTR